jgi:hypothetical protein
MNDSDVSEGEFEAAVTPRLKKKLHSVNEGEAGAGTETRDRSGPWQTRHKREHQERATRSTTASVPAMKKRAKRKYRKSTIDLRKVRAVAGMTWRLSSLELKVSCLLSRRRSRNS